MSIYSTLYSTWSNCVQYINKIIEEPIISHNKYVLEKVTNATVGIEKLLKASAYGGKFMSPYIATGFLINKEKGWILTNKHVANSHSIQDLYIKFYNGKKLEGQLIYDDPQHEFAVIQVNKDEIPIYSDEIILSKEKPQLKQQVFMIGFNGGVDFAYQDGKIISIDDIGGIFSTQVFTVSLNAKPGSSGSAVCNENGEAIALQFAISDVTAIAVPIGYISDAVSQLELGNIPVRNSLGITFQSCNLDDLAMYAHFPKNQVSFYMNFFPEARNKAICVDKIIPNTPAEGKFHTMDVLWKVNESQIQNDLYNFGKIIDQSNSTLNMEIFRDGNLLTININPYSLTQHAVKRMLDVDGLILVEVDEYLYMKIGIEPSTLYANPAVVTSSLNQLSNSIIEKLSNVHISNLDDVIKLLPQLKIEKQFMAFTKNMCHCEDIREHSYSAYAELETHLITLDETLYVNLYEFNDTSYKWMYHDITP